MKEEIYKVLHRSRSFVYKIGDKYYCIGAATFRECSDAEIQMYEEVIKKYSSRDWHCELYNEESLMRKFGKLNTQCDDPFDGSKENKIKEEIHNLLEACDFETLEGIEEQRKISVELLSAFNRYTIKKTTKVN